jgi:hypothetical protein
MWARIEAMNSAESSNFQLPTSNHPVRSILEGRLFDCSAISPASVHGVERTAARQEPRPTEEERSASDGGANLPPLPTGYGGTSRRDGGLVSRFFLGRTAVQSARQR